jgi:toxin ParE1/3/4
MPQKKFDVEYLPSAEGDLAGIISYIARDLAAPEAAGRLLDKLDGELEALRAFPYSRPVYPRINADPLEFRFFAVDSYLVFYYVAGEAITIARIIYGGRDIPGGFQNDHE